MAHCTMTPQEYLRRAIDLDPDTTEIVLTPREFGDFLHGMPPGSDDYAAMDFFRDPEDRTVRGIYRTLVVRVRG